MLPQWYVCKTLLSGTPDTNRRSLYYTDGNRHSDSVATFNGDMNEWTNEDEARLKDIVRLLNAAGATPWR